MQYFGPVQVTKVISPVAYEVDLPEKSRIHNVFHVSRLKKFKGEVLATVKLPEAVVVNQVATIPTVVLDSRTILKNNIPKKEILVQWEGEHLEETSWESMEAMATFFSSLDLEGKVDLNGNGDDRGVLRREAVLDDLGKLDKELAGERSADEEVTIAGTS